MARGKYDQLVDGVGDTVPANQKWRLACCDCGLVHDIVLVPGVGKEKHLIGIAVRRNARSTAARRRGMGVVKIVRKQTRESISKKSKR